MTTRKLTRVEELLRYHRVVKPALALAAAAEYSPSVVASKGRDRASRRTDAAFYESWRIWSARRRAARAAK